MSAPITPAIITVDAEIKPLEAQLEAEKALLKQVKLDQQPRIHIWRASQTLVATKTESRLPQFEEAQAELYKQGWPIIVRDTGGAAVPQSPATLNLSMMYRSKAEGFDIDSSYETLCRPIVQALANLGIEASATAVEGSFCDGKYNLAVQHQGTTKKIVGTSQKWSADKTVLSHAVILTSIDTTNATQMINRFYTLAGSDEKKSADVVVSISELLAPEPDLNSRLTKALVKACEELRF